MVMGGGTNRTGSGKYSAKKTCGQCGQRIEKFLTQVSLFFFLVVVFCFILLFFPVNREEADNVLNLKEAEWKIKNSGEF